MESTSVPQTKSNPQASPSKQGDPSQEQVRKRTTGFSKESLLSNLQEIAKEAEEIKQELPEEAKKVDTVAIQRQVEELDKKQMVWLWLYRCWLVYNIWEHSEVAAVLAVVEEFAEELGEAYMRYILISIFWMVLQSSRYLVLLLAIYKKSLRLNNIGIKITVVFGFFGLIQASFLCLILSNYEVYQKLGNELLEQVGLGMQYPAKEEFQWIVLESVGRFLADLFLTYGGAKFYRRYLLKRESLLKQKIE